MKPLTAFAPSTWNLEIYGSFSAVGFIPYGLPDVQNAYKALFEAGAVALKWIGTVAAYDMEMKAAGFPPYFGGGTKAPFDVLGDTLRGTKGIMLDIYRQPEKLLQAMEVLVPIMIKMGVSGAKASGAPIVFIPLHKGADGFLSDKQFKTFYWPTLKKVMLGLIEEGCVPFPWAEGGYNSRLEAVSDMPKATTVWGFDTTDMARAKEILGRTQCITGNMPIDLLNLGTKQQVVELTKKLIDTCAKGGGYIMMNGAVIEDAKAENVKAMIDTTKEYGVYK
jgi:uroporphyrinogen-III decarboxylase